jgi:quercetin dioxygenase-like cupin family protein
MHKLRQLLICLVVLGAAAIVLPATQAAATPGRGVSAETLFDVEVGMTHLVLKRITIQPGGSTGWHYHPSVVRGVVTAGVLTHYAADCSIDGVDRPGQVIVETAGPGYVHMGQNLGGTPVVLDVLYQAPVGEPLAVDMPNPGCPVQ